MPHDPATMSLLFSVGHWITGAFVFPIAALVVWEAHRQRGTEPARSGIPILLAGAGLTLAIYIVFHAGPAQAPRMLAWALGQAQQIQHFAFAALLVGMGLGEWIANRRGGSAAFVWPAGYLLLGLAFIVHEQLGADAHEKWLYHVALGAAIMAAGALRIAQIGAWLDWRRGGWSFAAVLTVVALMLVTYSETAPI